MHFSQGNNLKNLAGHIIMIKAATCCGLYHSSGGVPKRLKGLASNTSRPVTRRGGSNPPSSVAKGAIDTALFCFICKGSI